MRKTIIAGLVLALAAALVMWLSAVFDLELESVVLLGAAVGAVVALVPDRSPLVRFLGFAAGFVAAWVGYLVRAALLPDTAGGRAVAVGLILLLCVAVVARQRRTPAAVVHAARRCRPGRRLRVHLRRRASGGRSPPR